MSEKTLVVQHNSVIEARYRLSVEEQRLIKTLVSQIQSTDEDFKVYEIRIIDLARLLHISDTGYYDRVRKVTKKILGNVLVFTDEHGNEVQTSWLSSAKYYRKKGTVAFRFDPELKPYLLQLKRFFTSYELGNILRLNGIYSIRLYELLKQYEKIGRREFALEALKNVLGIDSEYKQYRDFKKWVLVPAENEISEKTDITYSMVETKRGRKVVGLTFAISRKNQIGQNPIVEQEYTKLAQLEEPKQTNQIVEEMVSLGVTRSTAEELSMDFGEEYIQSKIKHVLALEKEGRVKNPAGFLVEAIRNGYADNRAEDREKKEKALQETKAREEHTKKWERLKAAYSEAKNVIFEGWRSTLDKQVLDEHRERYLSTIAPMLKKSPTLVEKSFTGHLKSLMPFPSLQVWAEQVGIDVAEFKREIAQEEQQAGLRVVASLETVA